MRALWCLWFASSIAMPYFLGFAEPTGVVSYAGTYGFAALGMIMGIWFASHPTVDERLGDKNRLVFGLPFLGLGLSALLGFFELGRAAVLHSVALPIWTTQLNILAGSAEKPITLCNALLCGADGYWLMKAKTGHRTRSRYRHFLLLLAYLAGFTRGAAWTLLLPSPPYPLPSADWHLNPEDYWSSGLPLALGIAVAFSIMFAWAWVATQPQGHCDQQAFGYLVGALCLGELSWRLAARVSPSLLEIGTPQAIGALVVHGICLGTASLICLNLSRTPKTSIEEAASGSSPTECFPISALPSYAIDVLLAHGLTQKEIAVLSAATLRLTSSQTAGSLGINASTVRTYRARICKKLCVPNINQLVRDMELREGPFGLNGQPKSTSHRRESILQTLGTLGGSTLLLLVFMPCGRAIVHWDYTWLIPYGAALGLALPVIGRTFFAPLANLRISRHSWIPIVLIFTISTAAIVWCYHALAEESSHETPSMLLRASIILSLATCMLIAGNRTHACLAQPSFKRKSGICIILGSTALVMTASQGTTEWLVCLTISFLLTCLGIVFQNKETVPFQKHPGATPLLTLLCTAFLAFTWEEGLRGTVYASLQYCGVPFLVLIAGVTVYRFVRQRQSVLPLLVLICCSVMLIQVEGVACGLVAGILLSSFLLMHPGAALRPELSSSGWHTPSIAASFGACAAVYTANVWGTLINSHIDSAMSINMAFVTVLAIPFSIIGVLQATRVLGHSPKPHPNKDEVLGDPLVSFLRSRGLTPFQINVILSVAQGLSVSQMASKFSYSRSKINRVLKDIYIALGVQNRVELIALLDQRQNAATD